MAHGGRHAVEHGYHAEPLPPALGPRARARNTLRNAEPRGRLTPRKSVSGSRGALGEKNIHEEGIVKGDENILVNAVYWLTEKL